VDVVAFSPDGQVALSGGRVIKDVTLWNVTTGGRYGKLVGHTSGIRSAAFFPDGRRAITSGQEDGTVRIWDLTTCREIPIRDERVWDPATLRKVDEARRNLPYIDYPVITTFTLSPDGQHLLSPYGDELALFEVASGRHLRSFTGHTAAASSIAFFADGRRAVSGSYDRTVRTWVL
jgi:WD40 repeat protein